jgi:hypothetical protein
MKGRVFFNQDKIDSIRFKATDGADLSFAKWMKGERYHLKGARLSAYDPGISGGNKRQQLEHFSKLFFLIVEQFHWIKKPNR